ncbi:MAG: hypothetical protein AABZ32_11340, partial [Bacteroidota bacterium]
LDNKFVAQIRINTLLTEYTFLSRSGRNLPFAHHLLDDVIADAKKWDCYSDHVDALHKQKSNYGLMQGEKEYEKFQKETERYERYLAATRRSVDWNNKLTIATKFNANPDRKKILKIVNAGIKEMKCDYKLTGLPVVLYYQKILEIEYYFQHYNYKQAKQVCLSRMNLLKKYPSLCDSQRMGYVHDFMAQCYIILKEFKKAMVHLQLAQKNILKGTVDYLVSKEQDFFLLFYDGQYEKAKQIIETALKNFPADVEPFRKGKLNFFLACVLFKLNNHAATLKILRQKTEVFNDKAGWLFSSKLIEIMILHEMKNPNEMKSALERFRKFVGYNKEAFTKRDHAVVRLLYLLENCNFMLRGKNKREARKIITLLMSNRSAYRWLPYSHEVIRFEYWVQEELMGRRDKS